jgi:hypothetical protein
MIPNDGESGLKVENFIKTKFLYHFGEHFFPHFKEQKVVLLVTLGC